MPSLSELENEIKLLIIKTLGLEDISVNEIDSGAPLFGDGLGLDSIDALELGIALSKTYDVKLDPNSDDVQVHFASVQALAQFVLKNQAQA